MVHGLHHVTAISGPAAGNLAFHGKVLGQRLVKKTVNFDDPGTYHLYYGTEGGAPGSILTFFPWDHVAPGRIGSGETAETAFRAPAGALPFWAARLADHGIATSGVTERFGAPALAFKDPDGLGLAIVGVEGIENEPVWAEGGIAAEHALRGFHGVTLNVADPAATAAILTDVFGFTQDSREGDVTRYATEAAMGGIVDLKATPGLPRGRQGGGSVHHIAFRAADDAAQAAMVERLGRAHRLPTTEQKDRAYFRSVYFREPNGIIFEIATDVPGFAVDEAKDTLGKALKLPSFLESRRREIESVLPALV